MKKGKLDEKLTAMLVAIVVIFILLLSRLFYLQILHGEIFLARAEANSSRLIPVPARRGDILDCNGQVLATSRPVFVVSLNSYGLTDEELLAARLAPLLDNPEVTPESIVKLVRNNPRSYEPVEVARLPWEEEDSMEIVSRLEEHREELPGLTITTEPVRYYPYGALAGHVLGYVGRITKEELTAFADRQYSSNDLIGKIGLEKLFESYQIDYDEYGLRGHKGMQRVKVNSNSRPIGDPVSIIGPAPGTNLVTTLDLGLQSSLENSLDKVIADLKKRNPKAGGAGAVVLDVRSGAILAMASRPILNPNDFVDGLNSQEMSYYNNADLKPFNNRVVQGAYPPGSTFKMITGMAALDAGVITPDTTIICEGHYWQPPYIDCVGVHRQVNLYKAFAVSCNTFFQNAGFLAGVEKIDEVAQEFGLGEKTGTRDITGEVSGLLPTPEWKKAVGEAEAKRISARREAALEEKYSSLLAKTTTNEERQKLLKQKEQEERQLKATNDAEYTFQTNWQPFDTFNMSIGQGANNYTVLQLANYVATLANGGQRWQPYLVQRCVTAEGKVVSEFGPQLLDQVGVSQKTMNEVRQGMRQVALPGGTASFLFSDFPPEIQVACKTGTAQTGLAGDDPHEDFHGVFVAFAPFDHPEIAIAILMEYADSGGGSGGRVAREVFRTYFGL